jgi:hypothetical protein
MLAGLILGIFSILGFRHAGKVAPVATSNRVVSELITASS